MIDGQIDIDRYVYIDNIDMQIYYKCLEVIILYVIFIFFFNERVREKFKEFFSYIFKKYGVKVLIVIISNW